jgi:transcription elongation factor SPT6
MLSLYLNHYTGIVKRAVALGRFLQNPLAMIATLCGPGKEILSWKLHTLEQFLTPDEKSMKLLRK